MTQQNNAVDEPTICGERHLAWFPYVRFVADGLGLKDWDLMIDEAFPENDDAAAQINPTYGRKQAVIQLSSDFEAYPPSKQRVVIVHELLHAHFETMTCVFYQFSGRVKDDTYSVILTEFTRHLEYAIDGIATAIAHTFSLPGDVP